MFIFILIVLIAKAIETAVGVIAVSSGDDVRLRALSPCGRERCKIPSLGRVISSSGIIETRWFLTICQACPSPHRFDGRRRGAGKAHVTGLDSRRILGGHNIGPPFP
jgi:hypothetical protein